jgi:hypothetical protein
VFSLPFERRTFHTRLALIFFFMQKNYFRREFLCFGFFSSLIAPPFGCDSQSYFPLDRQFLFLAQSASMCMRGEQEDRVVVGVEGRLIKTRLKRRATTKGEKNSRARSREENF